MNTPTLTFTCSSFPQSPQLYFCITKLNNLFSFATIFKSSIFCLKIDSKSWKLIWNILYGLQIVFSEKPNIMLGLHFLRIHVMCPCHTNENISIVPIKWNLLSCSPVTCSKFALYMDYLTKFLLFLRFPRFGGFSPFFKWRSFLYHVSN